MFGMVWSSQSNRFARVGTRSKIYMVRREDFGTKRVRRIFIVHGDETVEENHNTI